jgi:hypothetical protein
MKLKERPSDGKHKVKDGEWVGSIAWDYGFPVWEVVWNHAKNAALREKRTDPHVLDEGDELFIPEPKPLDYFLYTGERHVFKLPRRTQLFRLQLLDEHGDPMREEPYKLTVKSTDDAKFEQKFQQTDSDGYVAEEIPLSAESGVLELTGRDHKMDLSFGKLTPIDLDDEDAKFRGTQQRLKALGFFDGDVDGKDSPRLKAALKAFQRFCRVNLASGDPAVLDPGPVDGIIGPRTRDALIRYYGS